MPSSGEETEFFSVLKPSLMFFGHFVSPAGVFPHSHPINTFHPLLIILTPPRMFSLKWDVNPRHINIWFGTVYKTKPILSLSNKQDFSINKFTDVS